MSVCIPTENKILSFAISELEVFTENLDDILTVINSNSTLRVHVCEACGSAVEDLEYTEPTGEDLQ